MNLLALVQQFCAKYAQPIPTGLFGVTEATTVQLRALCIESQMGLREYEWQQAKVRQTFTTSLAEDQGTLASKFGSAYRQLIPATMWNNTLQRPIFGPIGDISWQVYKAYADAGTLHSYKVMQDHLFIYPAPSAAWTCSAVIQTNYGCVAVDGTTYKEYFTADTDTPLYPDQVFLFDLEWRWRKLKGMPWAADYEDSQKYIIGALTEDAAKTVLTLDNTSIIQPGLVIPSGSWTL